MPPQGPLLSSSQDLEVGAAVAGVGIIYTFEEYLGALFEQAGVRPGSVVVAYCRTGGQASFLYTVARHLGYDVRMYDGSFIDWSRTDYPVER